MSISKARQGELDFEKDLINRLSSGLLATPAEIAQGKMNDGTVLRTQNWKYRPDLKTEEQLWQNFKEITEQHNQDKLDRPLSGAEFDQVKKRITELESPFQAGQFLYGLNGVAEIEVDMDNGEHKFLRIFDQKQVGAGETVYQVVNQVERPAVLPGKKDRRFDVTLLINGLPIIQIELKREGNPVDEALEQMRQYVDEKQYSGIFSTVQLLVGMNPYSARYMANTPSAKFNKDFAFHWQNEKDNSNIYGWRNFTDSFLSIPMAHNMATTYMVLDGEKNNESLKVMRSYQVYATQNVLESIKKRDLDANINRLGYIWHTTGSGKTITSFKTAWLASKMPGVDKVVFIVDRKDLTGQTRDRYRAYDPERTDENDGIIADTKNTNELSRKLKAKNNDIVVTTVQKLERLISRPGFKAPDRRFVFVVDEAHRSTGGHAFAKLQKAFPKSSWVGYTGTPIFEKTDARGATKEIFGDCLHAYTMREAIADQNVLGFKVEYNTTLTDEDVKTKYLPEYYRNEHPEWTAKQVEEQIKQIPQEVMSDQVPKSFYDMNENHVKEVVKDISEKWRNRSGNYKFNGMLTTKVGGNGASAPMAMMYFREFQKENERRIARGERALKVAVTFSQDTTNSATMVETNRALSEAIEAYNEQFGTNFDDTTVSEYREDLMSRVNKTAVDKNYLDLVIVVDQLLTGFDAPDLSTLYVDRVLRGAGLIQAYSRTNRIVGRLEKPSGQIVNYRWPKESEDLMNKALEVYANKNAAFKPLTLIEEGNNGNSVDEIILPPFHEQLQKARNIVDQLRWYTDGFTGIPKSEKAQEEMYQKLREYNEIVTVLKTYPKDKPDETGVLNGFSYDDPDQLIVAMGMTPEQEKLLTGPLKNELKLKLARKRGVDPSLIDLTMAHLKDVIVNYDYLTELIERLMNQVHEDKADEAEKTFDEIKKFANGLDDAALARDIRNAGQAILDKNYPDKDSGMKYPYKIDQSKDINAVVQQASQRKFDIEMYHFRAKYGISDFVTSQEIRDHINQHIFGERNDMNEGDWMGDIILQGQKVYKDIAADPEIRALSKIRYRNVVKEAFYELADETVMS